MRLLWCLFCLSHSNADALQCPQSKLQQQLRNSKANEQLMQGELESCKQQLKQKQQQQGDLQEQLQHLQRKAEADATEAKAAAERAVLQLQQQLSSDASSQV
jgi:chromosome segregation ATPase